MLSGIQAENGITRVFSRGRIVEVHMGRLASVADVAILHEQVTDALLNIGSGAIICADHRNAHPVSGKVADAFTKAMRTNKDGIVRSGTLLDPNNTMYNLQFGRVVHCAGNPACRVFENIDDLRDWVSGSLTAAERDALRDLFGGR